MAELFSTLTTTGWILFIIGLVALLISGFVMSRHLTYDMDHDVISGETPPRMGVSLLIATPIGLGGCALLLLQNPLFLLFGIVAFLIGLLWFIVLLIVMMLADAF